MQILAPATKVAITAATALGAVTVANATIYPGAKVWLCKDDGSARARCLVISLISTTGIMVRRYPNDDDGKTAGFGFSDVSAFNTTSHLNMEQQLVPIDPAFAKKAAI